MAQQQQEVEEEGGQDMSKWWRLDDLQDRNPRCNHSSLPMPRDDDNGDGSGCDEDSRNRMPNGRCTSFPLPMDGAGDGTLRLERGRERFGD